MRGTSGRLLYEADVLTADDVARILSQMLSPGTPVADAAGFFEGFFESASQRLIFDDTLRIAVADWVATLEDETFTEYLPLFRRVLSSLDPTERRHLLDRLFGGPASGGQAVLIETEASLAAWEAHYPRIIDLLSGKTPTSGTGEGSA